MVQVHLPNVPDTNVKWDDKLNKSFAIISKSNDQAYVECQKNIEK